MVEELRTELEALEIVFVGIPGNLLNREEDLGSDWHPSYRGQLKSAHMLIPVLGTMLDWNYSLNEILENLKNKHEKTKFYRNAGSRQQCFGCGSFYLNTGHFGCQPCC